MHQFVHNYRKIQELNAQAAGRYELEVNAFATLSDEEFARRYTGLRGISVENDYASEVAGEGLASWWR